MRDPRDSLLLAQAPNTSEAELEFLAAYQGPEVRRAIAAHPNASLNTLLSLLADFPADVLRNPTLLRFLEREPEIPLRSYAGGVHRLLELPGLSAEIHQRLFAFLEKLSEARLREAAHGSLLYGQFDAQDFGLYSKMLQHPEYPPERLVAALLGAVPEHRRAAALHPRAPRPLLQQLVSLGSSEDLTARIGSPSKPLQEEALGRLSRQGFWPQYLLAAAPSTPVRVLESLLTSPFAEVRRLIAKNENTPGEFLRVLSTEGDTTILGGVAANHKTPPECLRALHEKNPYSFRVKSCLAQNPMTPNDVLLKLSGESSVRQHLIERQNLPEAALQKLIKTLTRRDQTLWRALADGQYLTEKLAAFLYQKQSKDIKQSLASNDVCAPEVLLLLVREKNVILCGMVARNLNATTRALRELEDAFEELRASVLAHPNLGSFQALIERLIGFGRELMVDLEEAGLPLDALAQRAIMTFEAAAPQGFLENAWPVFSSLSESLLAQEHPLLGYLGLLAKCVSRSPDGAPLGSLRAKAAATLLLLGESPTKARERATRSMGL